MPIIFKPHRRATPAPPPPAPPFDPTSAVNGLSVDPVSGAIVLGQDVGAVGDPAQLLSNREIPFNGFSLDFRGMSIDALFDDLNSRYSFANAALDPGLWIDFVNTDYVLGDFNNFVDPVLFLRGQGSGSPYAELYLQNLAGTNYMDLFVDMSSQNVDWTLHSPGLSTDWFFDMTQFFYRVTGQKFLNVDSGSDGYSMGRPTTGPLISFDGGGFAFRNNSTDVISADTVTQEYFIGDLTNGPYMKAINTGIPDFRVGIQLGANPVATVFKATGNPGAFTAGIGDLDIWENGITLNLDDFNKEFIFDNFTHDSKIRINNTLGFTGTVTPVNSITVIGGIVTAVS